MLESDSESFSDQDFICYKCVAEATISDRIEAEGKDERCAQCDHLAKCWTIEALAELVDPVIRDNYYPVAESFDYPWQSPGEEPVDVVAELLRVEPAIAAAIIEVLSHRESFDVCAGADVGFYGDNNLIADTGHASAYAEVWTRFEERFKHNARFFDDEGRKILDELFGDLPSLAKGAAVVTIKPEDDDSCLFRARVFFNSTEAEEALSDPAKYLGPPAPRSARAGRMNPAGIRVLYGAFSEEVALAEVRPPVGSIVEIGKFKPLRELRVLDLTKLSALYHNASPFSQDYRAMQNRLRFLHTFEARVSRVVLPSDETFDYLPTQAVASYVTNVLHLDGIVYRSQQAVSAGADETRTARNIALFGSSAVVEATTRPLPKPEEFNYLIQPLARAIIDACDEEQVRFDSPNEPALRIETDPLPKTVYISAVTVTSTPLNTSTNRNGEVSIWDDDDLYDRDDD